MAYTKYSLTPADNNAAPPNGAPEGMLPSGVNDTMRDMMSQIRDAGDGIRNGTYTMTAPVIIGGSVSGVTFSSAAATITGGSVSGVTFSSSAATITGGSVTSVTFSSSAATITGGSVSGITDLAIADGGTGASTAENARINLGVDNYGMLKNRIINGAMVIDQRNAGASVAGTNGNYVVDRFLLFLTQNGKLTGQQNAGSITPPVGFSNYLGITSSSAYSVVSGDILVIRQGIEGFNIADLNWGSANAKTVTLSFWVRSSLTGTFGGSLANGSSDRSYPFSYTISSANTWEQKSITIVGDTTGTWATNNTGGIYLNIGLGVGSTYAGTAGSWSASNLFSATGATSVVGTSGATFYITGVQLEVGTQATSFEYRQYGTELALCQRYYYKSSSITIGDYITETGFAISATSAWGINKFPVTMRISPTSLEQSGTAGNYQVVRFGAATANTCSAVPTFTNATPDRAISQFVVSSGLSNGMAGSINALSTAAFLAWSAEL